MFVVDSLTKYFGYVAAISGVSFQINEFETTGIFGTSTSGKTTLLDVLSGYLLKYRGTIRIDGADASSDPAMLRKYISYIPKDGALYTDMNVMDFMNMYCDLNGIQKRKRRTLIQENLEFAGCQNMTRQNISNLNKYDRARISVAAALTKTPKILLIDEPYIGLRSNETDAHSIFLKAVAQKTTLIMASSSIVGFSELCKRTIILNRGRIVSNTDANLFQNKERKKFIRMKISSAPDDAKEAFQFVPGIIDLDFSQSSEQGLWDVIINIADETSDDIREQVWNAAATAGIPVYEMRMLQVSPEDLYLQMTGRDTAE
ncbi:MAG: ABC transporter ATP-binding protein [Clostridia bacterium]|nr:ABC transporter ATP-binding protein [Clostridia bacterium]